LCKKNRLTSYLIERQTDATNAGAVIIYRVNLEPAKIKMASTIAAIATTHKGRSPNEDKANKINQTAKQTMAVCVIK
jgi:hypothetical protein